MNRRALDPLQQLAEEIALDGGRGLPNTLRHIRILNVDYVKARIPTIHRFLGDRSPGVEAIVNLVEQVAHAPAAKKRPDQHVISKVVLKQFAVSGLVSQFDLDTGVDKARSPERAGYIHNLVSIDSEATEHRWELIETRVPLLLKAIVGGAINPEDENTLRELVALHYVRNGTFAKHHEQSFGALAPGIIQTTLGSFSRSERAQLASNAFREQFHIEPVGPEGLRRGEEILAERLLTSLREPYDDGSDLRYAMEHHVDRALEVLEAQEVRLYTTANIELIISDHAAVALDHQLEAGEVGIGNGITVLPLTPHQLVAIGNQPLDDKPVLDDDKTSQLNKAQIRMAVRYVYYRPSADIGIKFTARGDSD